MLLESIHPSSYKLHYLTHFCDVSCLKGEFANSADPDQTPKGESEVMHNRMGHFYGKNFIWCFGYSVKLMQSLDHSSIATW